MARLRLGLTGFAVALVATAFAQTVDAPVGLFREAVELGALGTIRGRAFEERRRPSAADLPLGGTVVKLLPRSEAWLSSLAAIKRESRESSDAFRHAAGAVRRSGEMYEQRLWEAGAGDLPQTATVDSDGVFALDRVPAGPWIVLASRSTYVNKTPQVRPGAPPRPPGPTSPFLPLDKLAGYHVVTFWMREVTVAAGVAEAIELTDRNAWLTGVVEDRQRPPLPDQPYEPRR